MTTDTMTKIFAGPWIGEFGWELFCWQGYLRALAGANNKVIVCARPGHEALYEDFAHDFIPFTPPAGMPDCHWLRGNPIERFGHLVPNDARWLKPGGVEVLRKGGCPYIEGQEFIPFGKPIRPGKMKYDVLIHARDRRHQPTVARNWPREKWLELCSQLPEDWSIGWIGTKDEAMSHGSNDLRGISLRDLIQVLRQTRLVIGPSSGPMHLASLCEVPHVVWSGNSRDVPRYAEVWNPFKVRHMMIQTWQPSIGEVLNRIHGFLG